MSISGTIGGATESAAYTYDNLGRLVTSNQTSNGSSAQRRFAYDRWGNRTGMWDATSGGNQIQTIALEQSGGAPTNRIQSVTSSGGPTPAAYWKFDETSGTTAADSSGNGNTGTLENGPTWTAGKINNGVNLDGVNDDVLVPSSATVNPSTAVSVAAWFKATSAGTYQFLINKFNHNSGTTSDDSYTLGIDPGGNFYWQVATSLSTYLMTPAPPVSVLDGQFHHIAATYDGTLMKVYLDGGLLSSMNASGTIVVSSTPVLLGASLNNGARAFFQKGVLDEARIYNQALSASEVQALSQNNPGASYAYDSAGNVTNDGVHVDLVAKPAASDPTGTVHGDWRIFNGDTSQMPASRELRALHTVPGAVIYDPSQNQPITAGDIFLYPLFFDAAGSARINPFVSRGVLFIHEGVHLTGRRDTDFGSSQTQGSHNLSDIIIHSCVQATYSYRDLSFPIP